MVGLESVKLFSGLGADELEGLRRIAQERQFSAGREIFREGDSGDGVYIIRGGLVEIAHLVGSDARRVFSRLGGGEIFGEMAVIEGLPRSATAVAVEDTRVCFIPRDEMLALLRHSPALAFNVLQEISQRLRDFNQLHLREIVQAERLAVVGNFARSIVHDLKNPLGIISLASKIMEHPGTAPEVRAQAQERIQQQVGRISEMVGDILDFTQNVRPDAALPPVRYPAFILDLMGELRAEAGFKSMRLKLENEAPEIQLRFDPRRLRRVFFNLIGNAIDMMPPGGGILLRFQSGAAEILTEIEDTGPGIAPEIAGRLFEPFATHGKAHGTGLGLSICKKIIEDHGGRIWTRNEPGHGAIFCFTLPLPKQT